MSSFLNNLKVEIKGESHSSKIYGSIGGIKRGYEINISKIEDILKKRNPNTFFNTSRKDTNKIYFISGMKDNITDGETIEFYLENNDINSKVYNKYHFRLGHADYVSFKKFGHDYPYAGGGPFSGRMTALVVVIGEITRQVLEQRNVEFNIYSQIKNILDYESVSILHQDNEKLEINNEKKILNDEEFLCYLKDDQSNVLQILKEVKEEGDSVGCELEFKLVNKGYNFGDIYFNSLESKISYAIFNIPGIKGIKFGVGDDFYRKRGSSLLEKVVVNNNEIRALNNINGGINGGISNGYQDIYFTVIVKPPVSINKDMDILKYNNGTYSVEKKGIEGRHDSFIGNKVAYVVKAWMYIILLDSLED